MSRIIEEPKQHIHDKLVGELNEMSIRIKLWDFETSQSAEPNKIMTARIHHPKPTMEEILSLIDRCRDEMNQCTQPYKIH